LRIQVSRLAAAALCLAGHGGGTKLRIKPTPAIVRTEVRPVAAEAFAASRAIDQKMLERRAI
jgi:hypothetical protein